MKPTILLTILSFLILSTSLVNAQKSVDRIFDQLKDTKNYEGVSVPGWVIKLGLLAVSMSEDEDTNEVLDLGKKIKKIRVATTNLDTKKYNTKSILNNFAKRIAKDDGFEEYVSVKSGDENLKIMIQEDGKVIKNLIIMNEDKGSISVVHLKANLSYDDIRKVSFNKLKNDIQYGNTITE